MGVACVGMCIGATADQQDEISLWKLKLVAIVAEIHCKRYTRNVKEWKNKREKYPMIALW